MITSYQRATAERRTEPRYDEEISSVNWNPAIGPIAPSSGREDLSPNLPEDSSNFDVDGFLDRAYAR